ncbi:demethoxyubiquinone hydroxylase family protein [Catenovulum agarivorans]|uniref:demethoxyubiquinone hydroxylase family protein n=1 Tax=Catenovulum agarivorans TaxID=1172192 RepID=UPI000312901A|nr:demethoxyubiquinone hydroxylase family protein [Catenovulum agarivorans]
MDEIDKQLKIMHACEKGATGVYYGHRLVAKLLYQDIIPELDEMHRHEVEHYKIFGQYIAQRKFSSVLFPTLWCGTGILYGLVVGILGRNAIRVSTSTIESIVDKEMTLSIQTLMPIRPELANEVSKILEDEREHQSLAAEKAKYFGMTARLVS